MSQENVEIVRQVFLAASSGDFVNAGAAFDPAIEWHMSGVTGWVEQQAYRGRPEVLEFLEGWRQSWDGWHFDLEEVYAGMESQVFAAIHERAKGADTGATVDQHSYFANTLRDGKIVQVRMFRGRQDALKAAGLAE